LRPAGHERERLVHDLVAEHAAAPAQAPGDRARRGRVAILDVLGVGEELPERGNRGRCEAPGVEIGERTAEVGIPARAEQQIERPARRGVLADLLGERVLMEVDDDEDAAPLADGDDGGDAVEVATVVLAGLGLERAPADRQPEQVEAEPPHPVGVAGVERRDGLEREAAVGEGDVEDALRSCVHAPERDLTPVLVSQATVGEVEPAAVEASLRGWHGEEQEHEKRERSVHPVFCTGTATRWRWSVRVGPRPVVSPRSGVLTEWGSPAKSREESTMRKMREAVIVATARTGMAKSFRGSFNQTRPDDMAAHCIKPLLQKVPQLDPKEIDDVVMGTGFPEGPQGFNVGRNVAVMGGLP